MVPFTFFGALCDGTGGKSLTTMEAFDNVAASTQALDASDAALDLAMSRWKGTAAQDESGITVSHGFLPNQALLSFCWAQEFKFSKNLLSTLLQLFDGSGMQPSDQD